MMLRTIKNLFNQASRDSGKDCLVNYVWINWGPDDALRKEDCSVSLKHIDCAHENARLYPDARVKIWIDFHMLDKRSADTLYEHHREYAPDNVTLCDLRSIPDYRENTQIFGPYTTKRIWTRVDLARLIVLDHAMKTEPERHVFYADFDVPDLVIEKAKAMMKTHEVALATTKSIIPFFQSDNLENGFFAFRKGMHSRLFLTELLSMTFKSAHDDRNGFDAFIFLANDWARRHGMDSKTDMAIRGVLYEMGYKIPNCRRYKRLNWN